MFFVQFYIYIGILYLAFLAGLTVYSRKDQPLYLRLLPLFIAITTGVEIAVHILSVRNKMQEMYLYRIWLPIEFAYYLYIAYKVLTKKWIRKTIVILTPLYFTGAIIDNIFFFSGWFPTLTYCSGAFLVVFVYLFYFFELVDYPITLTPKREPAFWLFLGVTVYYAGTLPVWVMTNLLYEFSIPTLNKLSWVIWVLNYFLYACMLMAFLSKGLFRKKSIHSVQLDDLGDFRNAEEGNALFR